MRIHTTLCALLIVSGAACASSQAEQVKDARMEQTDARTTRATRAIENREAARDEAIDKKTDIARANIEEAGGTDESASKQMLDVTKDRASYQSKAQARLETIGVRIHAAREKLAAVGPKASIQLQDELKAIEKEHKLLKQDYLNLPESSAANWESAKNKLDDRLTALNERLKDLTDKIENV